MFERRLTLDTIQFVNSRCFVLAFRSPAIAAAAQPGQFLMLSVGSAIEPLLRRPMAVYQRLTRGGEVDGFSVLVERTGRGTTLMSQLRAGDEVDVLGPLGRAFEAPTDPEAEAVLVMGGVGSAPFPLFAEQLVATGRRVRAFLGGRTADHLLCADDLEGLGVVVHVATDDGSAGHHGLVTEPLAAYLDACPHPPALYSCGPTPMMRAVDALARERGLAHQVSLEAPMACGLGVCLSCVVPVADADGTWHYRRVCREGPVFDASTLLWEHPDG
jgi:dihydroorotate dehydrogenase electron transfer subunit